MRLLIVDDDAPVRRLVSNRLSKRGISVTGAASGAEALDELQRTTFEVVILDLALRDGSGFDLLRVVREVEVPPHVIILSAAGSEANRVRALEQGADDYVVKPFFVRELTARVLAVGRRQDLAKDTALRHGGLVIDLAARQTTIDGVPIDLTIKEFDLLAFLASRPRHGFSRAELLRSVWQSDPDWQQESTVTEHVSRLRSKIEKDQHRPRLLMTVRGVGYRFDPPAPEHSDHGAGMPLSPHGPGTRRCRALGGAARPPLRRLPGHRWPGGSPTARSSTPPFPGRPHRVRRPPVCTCTGSPLVRVRGWFGSAAGSSRH